jgi:hypothetical protein
MQNFAAPFEPELLPGVTVQDWQALLAAPLLLQLGSGEALVIAVTEETVAAGARRFADSLCCVVLHAFREMQQQHQSGKMSGEAQPRMQ